MSVALHPEGVDRNLYVNSHYFERREVALHPEGVDRNSDSFYNVKNAVCRPPPGGRG